MRLTTKSEYSILALIYMARQGEGAYVRIEDICRAYEMPKKYLEQLLLVLRQHRVIRARRGVGGGYALARPAAEVSVAEIIRLMDGALAPTESVSQYFFSHTPLEKEPKIIGVFRDIRDYIARKLETLTLAELL